MLYEPDRMTLLIRIIADDGESVLRLIGRIRSDELDELQTLIATNGGRVVLDLEEVELVDRSVVGFLGRRERDGVELRSCPPWIREWIVREAENPA